MPRTKVFVSYSHVDGEWRERLVTHLSVLERKGLVDVWADTAIRVGEAWESLIDEQLLECRVAILLISPNFLASPFIQDVEVKELLERHQRDGLRLVPVIARPCAWRLVDRLSQLQCRPEGGRALSCGSEADTDGHLAMLTYELGAVLGELGAGAMEDMAQLASRATQRTEAITRLDRVAPAEAIPLLVGRSWRGHYRPILGDGEQSMHLILDSVTDAHFAGKIEWSDRGVSSFVDGEIIERSPGLAPVEPWRAVLERATAPRSYLRFTDTRQEGSGQIELHGDYRAVIQADGAVVGLWYRTADAPAPVGEFRLAPE